MSRTSNPRRWLPAAAARRLRFADAHPVPGRWQTSHASVQIAMDADRPHGWMVLLDDVLASYVALEDATHLEFEYTRWIADLVDGINPGQPLSIVHLGGAACTLPVYFELTRPGSRQVVIEYDAALIDLMREQFGIRSSRALRVRCADALDGLRELPESSADVIVRDAFSGAHTPAHLRDGAFAEQVHRVLRPGGVYVANIGDRPGLALTRELFAATCPVFGLRARDDDEAKLAIICDPAILRGRRFGNVVAAMSASRLPLEGWLQASRSAAAPARVTFGERLWPYL